MNGWEKVAKPLGGKWQGNVSHWRTARVTERPWGGKERRALRGQQDGGRWRRATRRRCGRKGRGGLSGPGWKMARSGSSCGGILYNFEKDLTRDCWKTDRGGGVQEVRTETRDEKRARGCGRGGTRVAWLPGGGGRAALSALVEVLGCGGEGFFFSFAQKALWWLAVAQVVGQWWWLWQIP